MGGQNISNVSKLKNYATKQVYATRVSAKFIAPLISSLYPSSKTSLTRKVFSGGYNERFSGYKFHLRPHFYAGTASVSS